MKGDTRRDEIVTLAVYPETKEKWEAAARDDPNADSLSQFVRVAVNLYLHDRTTGSGTELPENVSQQLSQVIADQEGLERRLDEIKGQLSDVRESVQGATVRPEIEELAGEVLEILPTESEIQIEPVMADEYDPEGVPPPESGSVEWLTTRVDRSSLEVQAALDHLVDSLHLVQRTEDGRYYKEV